jgi:hypothetical protein
MNRTLRAALVIARRQAFETILSPALNVTTTAGLLVASVLVWAFTGSIDSAGFNASQNPVYEVLDRLLVGLFGSSFVDKVFAEGPFVLALVCAAFPVFVFLAISSVFRFGIEKSAGAIALLTYGPADRTSYALASFLKDVVFAAAALLANLELGPLLAASLPVLFCLSLAIFAYSTLCSVLASGASSALAAFLVLMVAFVAVLAGSLAAASDSLRTVTSIVAAALQWFSPFYYASIAVRATQAGSALGFLGGLGALLGLTAALLAAGHGLLRRREVSA